MLADAAGHPISLTFTLDVDDMHTLTFSSATEHVDVPLGGWQDPVQATCQLARLLRIENIQLSYPEARKAQGEEMQRQSRHRDCSTEQCIFEDPDNCPWYRRRA